VTYCKVVPWLAALLLATAPLALPQGTYTQISVPGASFTVAESIDTAGEIVGAYGRPHDQVAGFFLSGGTYTSIRYPGAAVTYLIGINDKGEIVGYTPHGPREEVGFVYSLRTRQFTTIGYPGALSTYPYTINNAGVIGGNVYYEASVFGFDYYSEYKPISPPGTTDSQVTGISASGVLVGLGHTALGVLNFMFYNGNYTYPVIPNAPGAALYGTNPAGTALVGYYTPSSGTTAGFLYEGKELTTLEFPASATTYVNAVNSVGTAVGTFVDASGNYQGFTWVPPADAAKK
jgi:uncharacterized membrane protein